MEQPAEEQEKSYEEQEAEGEAAFDEDDENKEEKSEEEAEEKEEKEPPKEDEEEQEEESEEKEEEEPKTAKERLEKRLEKEGPEEESEEEEKAEEEEEREEEKAPVLTKEDVANRLSTIDDGELPGEMIIGNQTINLKEYATQYPDEWAAIKVVSGVVAEKIIEERLGGLDYAKPEDYDKKITGLESRINQLNFDNSVALATDEDGNLRHPDYHNIVYGAGKEDFHKWVKEQNKKTQKLTTSMNYEDALLLLDYYKEDTAKARKKAVKDENKHKKGKTDALHGETGSKTKNPTRTPRSPESMSIEEAEAEAENAFNEED